MSEAKKKVECSVPGAQATMEGWLARGDSIGVFRNHDLSHSCVGRSVFLPLTPDECEHVAIGQTRAPDSSSYGLGWRYLLDAIVAPSHDIEEAIAFTE